MLTYTSMYGSGKLGPNPKAAHLQNAFRYLLLSCTRDWVEKHSSGQTLTHLKAQVGRVKVKAIILTDLGD